MTMQFAEDPLLKSLADEDTIKSIEKEVIGIKGKMKALQERAKDNDGRYGFDVYEWGIWNAYI